MKFLIVGDLHGQRPEIRLKCFDCIIAPGDFCPSDIVRKYAFRALELRIKNPKSKIKWYDFIGKKEAKKVVKDSLKVGRGILEYLDSFDVPVYTVPGNNDFVPKKEEWKFLQKNHYKDLIKGLKNIINIQNRIFGIDGYQLIGYGENYGPEYPQHEEDLRILKTKDLKNKKKEYQKLIRNFSSLFRKAKKPIVFLSHNVPFDTPIDVIVNKHSPRNGWHYGSLVAREMVDKYQPLVCIGGHIHEHFGKCKIGKTVCINTGFGSKVNILMELESNKIKKLEFYRGK